MIGPRWIRMPLICEGQQQSEIVYSAVREDPAECHPTIILSCPALTFSITSSWKSSCASSERVDL